MTSSGTVQTSAGKKSHRRIPRRKLSACRQPALSLLACAMAMEQSKMSLSSPTTMMAICAAAVVRPKQGLKGSCTYEDRGEDQGRVVEFAHRPEAGGHEASEVMSVDASVAQHAGVTPRANSKGVESLMLAESVQAFLRGVRRGADLRDQGQVEADVVRVVAVRSNVAFCVRRPVQRAAIRTAGGRCWTHALL